MAHRPFSVHAHGLFYNKAGEGSFYADHSSDAQQRDDKVKPNNVYTYNWVVNEQHAPTETDEDCITRMYHSHVISVKDTNTGLIGKEGSSYRVTKSVYIVSAAILSRETCHQYLNPELKVDHNYSKIQFLAGLKANLIFHSVPFLVLLDLA